MYNNRIKTRFFSPEMPKYKLNIIIKRKIFNSNILEIMNHNINIKVTQISILLISIYLLNAKGLVTSDIFS